MLSGIFTEEIIDSWRECGVIKTSFSPLEVREKIYLSLHNSIRFNGLVHFKYNVLAHSWMVGMLAHDFAVTGKACQRTQLESHLMGMLHDIGECIVGDVIWPLKTGLFEEQYNLSYFQLEAAFRNWAGEYAFGIENFSSVYSGLLETVLRADRLAGELELFGVSAIADYQSVPYLGPVLKDIVNMVSIEKFDGMVELLKKEISNESAV